MPLVKAPEGAKEALQAALTEDVNKDAPVEASNESEENSSEPEITEDDLKEYKDRQIPYTRFKEVIEEKKKLKGELGRLKSNYQDDMRRAIEETEMRLTARMSQMAPDHSSGVLDLDEPNRTITRQISSLQDKLERLNLELEESRLNATLSTLKSKYPYMDETSVLGKKKAVPEADIEELARGDHERVEEMANRIVENIIQKKKSSAKKPITNAADLSQKIKAVYEETKGKKFEERQSALAKLLKANKIF